MTVFATGVVLIFDPFCFFIVVAAVGLPRLAQLSNVNRSPFPIFLALATFFCLFFLLVFSFRFVCGATAVRKTGINIHAVQKYGKQLMAALKHMASRNLVHADIKPDNILVDQGFGSLKLADFGYVNRATLEAFVFASVFAGIGGSVTHVKGSILTCSSCIVSVSRHV